MEAKIKDILAEYENFGPQRLRNALKNLGDVSVSAARTAQSAFDSYFADARQRQATVQSEIGKIDTELGALSQKIACLTPRIIEATVAGDSAEAKQVRAAITELETKKLELSAQKKSLEDAHIPGSKELYDAAQSAFDEFLTARATYRDAKHAVFEFAYRCSPEWNSLENWAINYDIGGGNGPKIEKLHEHFNHRKHNPKKDATTPNTKMVNLETARYVFGNDKGPR